MNLCTGRVGKVGVSDMDLYPNRAILNGIRFFTNQVSGTIHKLSRCDSCIKERCGPCHIHPYCFSTLLVAVWACSPVPSLCLSAKAPVRMVSLEPCSSSQC